MEKEEAQAQENTEPTVPKAPEPSKAEQAVDEVVAEKVKSMPQEEPVADGSMKGYLDQRISELEEHMGAMFVQMGGIVNKAGSQQLPDEPVSYTPLDKLDYTI